MGQAPMYSVVIPAYNEGPHLRTALATIRETLEALHEAYEMILVDDGSTDDTWVSIVEESKSYPMLRAVRLSRNFGKESAVCAGLEMARGSAVIVMDGDLQHPPPLIPEMVRTWREERAEVVEAVKESRGRQGLTNRLGAKIFYAILNGLSGYDLRGATDYKLMDRRIVDAWLEMRERSLFFRGMVAWLGPRRVQISFVVPDRVSGRSRWSIFKLVRLALTAVTAFSVLPLHFVTLAGMGFFLFAVVLGGQTLFLKVTGGAVSGFTTVILLVLIIGSALMIGLGIIGEYISRIYEEVKGRPRYVVAERIENAPDTEESRRPDREMALPNPDGELAP